MTFTLMSYKLCFCFAGIRTEYPQHVLFSFADLSDCQLMQVPDAIYFMMRNTALKACILSSNVITKIPAKFPSKFSLITGNCSTSVAPIAL